MWPISLVVRARPRNSVAACSAPTEWRAGRWSPSMDHPVWASLLWRDMLPTSCASVPHAQLFADLRGDEGAGLDPTVVLHQFLRALGATSAELPSTIETAARAFRSRLAGRW